MTPAASHQSPMIRIGKEMLEAYLREDSVAALLTAESRPTDRELMCQRWLADTPPKRLAYEVLYGDLLQTHGRHVLDVGGGLTALTRRLAATHHYELIDPVYAGLGRAAFATRPGTLRRTHRRASI